MCGRIDKIDIQTKKSPVICGKKMFVKIGMKNEPVNNYIDRPENIRNLVDMLRDCEENDGYLVEAIYMTEEEFLNLPEFAGF